MNFNTNESFNSNLIIACDVCKNNINLLAKSDKFIVEKEILNRTEEIKKMLKSFSVLFRNIWVVAEPTGVYHKNLFSIAKQLGLYTAYVSAESVSKMRVIETNDTGKTDIKDPHVIHTLARIGKIQKHRFLPEPYNLLRRWNKIYDIADQNVVKAKGSVHTVIKELFSDFNMKKDFLFSVSGNALMNLYNFNPFKITQSGKNQFKANMKKAVPRIKHLTIDKIYDAALASTLVRVNYRYIEILELELGNYWQNYQISSERKLKAKEEMELLYDEACCIDPKLPCACKGFITKFHLARIIAETGPLSDFNCWRKLMRFAGYNLCERQSGKYKGKTKISKKGRRLIRKVLNLIILPLIKKQGIYGTYYHKKKETMPGTKAMTAVSRHFLKMLYGVYKAGTHFNADRIFVCESQLKKAA